MWVEEKTLDRLPAYFDLETGEEAFLPVEQVVLFEQAAILAEAMGLLTHRFIPSAVEYNGPLKEAPINTRLFVLCGNQKILYVKRLAAGWKIIGYVTEQEIRKITRKKRPGEAMPLSYGLAFYYFRLGMSLTPRDIYEQLGVGPSVVSKFENTANGPYGVKLDKLESFAATVGIQVSQLLDLRNRSAFDAWSCGVEHGRARRDPRPSGA